MPTDQDPDERKPYDRAIGDPPERVVRDGEFVFGCWNAPPAQANMLDLARPYHYPVPRWVKDSRCKEWVAFQFGDRRWFFFTSLYDVKSFTLARFSAWDREKKRLFEWKRLTPLGRLSLGDELKTRTAGCRERHGSVKYAFDLDQGSIRIDVRSTKHGRRSHFAGSFEFAYNARQTAPMSACLPLGLNLATYSTRVLMPMQGWFEAGGERREFSAPEAMGLVDDHKGYYPYQMRYDWVAGFGLDGKGRRVGFSLTDNQVRDQDKLNENVLWINSRAFPLPSIRVTRPNGPDGPWFIQDTEGLVDLTFKPERKNDLKVNLLFAASDYHGPFGSYEGTLRSPDGSERVDAAGIYGVGEQRYLRA